MKLDVRPNWIDRIVSYISPVRGQQRLQARTRMALASSYTGASRSKRSLKEWSVSSGDADTDTLDDIDTLRERSRDLVRNAPLATGALKTKTTSIVGTGLRLNAQIEREFLGLSDDEADEWEANTEREFNAWAGSQECDIERTLNFYSMQALAFHATLESGDSFVTLPFVDRPGSIYGLKLQLIEADRVSNPKWQRDSAQLSGGIERDRNNAPIRYWFSRQHPGNLISRDKFEWDAVQAFRRNGQRNVLHLYHKLRPGQSRGVPDLAPVIDTLKQLDRYTEAEITSAVISGMFTVFIKTEGDADMAPMEPTSETGAKASDKDYKMSSGAIIGLDSQESIETADPKRPNEAFDPFVQAILRQIGAALQIPFEILVKHFTASYSAARSAFEEAWRFYMTQRGWLSAYFCQPIYEAWLAEAIARGRINAPGYLDDPSIRKAYSGAEWIGPAKSQIDPLKETQASKLRIEAGLSTKKRETTQMTGGDWMRDTKQRAKERRIEQDNFASDDVSMNPTDDQPEE